MRLAWNSVEFFEGAQVESHYAPNELIRIDTVDKPIQLPAENALPRCCGAATTEQVVFQRLEFENGDDGLRFG